MCIRDRSWQRVELGAALELKHPDCVGAAQHVVDALLVFRQGREGPRFAGGLLGEIDRALQGAQHAEAEQVELHETHGGAVVFVPLQHLSLIHI